MKRSGGPEPSVPLAGPARRVAAERLAGRLIAEGIGVALTDDDVGTTIWVRPTDLADAVVCAGLFDEVDAGISLVAPAPRTLWQQGVPGQLLAIFLLLVILGSVLAIVLAAV